MFSVELEVLLDETYKMKDAMELLESAMRELGKSIKVGALIICSPDEDTLIQAFAEKRDLRTLEMKVLIQSVKSTAVVNYAEVLSAKLREGGYRVTLASRG